jgi:3',5'-cyclic-AMP phosphodiesterase
MEVCRPCFSASSGRSWWDRETLRCTGCAMTRSPAQPELWRKTEDTLDVLQARIETLPMLIAQLSDIHVGGGRYRQDLLRQAIAEINAEKPDLVVVAGDLTDDGYPDQYPLVHEELSALSCPEIVRVPGNHDARNVGYLRFEDTFGARDSRLRSQVAQLDLELVAVDSSKPDLDEGEIGREHYGWIEEGFEGRADLRLFVCHHHLVPIPGTGRERNQVLDAGDVLSLLRQCGVDLVLAGHRHVPYVWPVAGMLLVHSGTVSTLRTRGFPHPAYNLVRVEGGRISVELRVPGGERRSLGNYPRDWPEDISARHADPFVRAQRELSLAEDQGAS